MGWFSGGNLDPSHGCELTTQCRAIEAAAARGVEPLRYAEAMSKGLKDVPELVRVAQALEDELVGLEALSRSVRKIRLDSEKNITRAARELQEALALPDRLAARLHEFAESMQKMQVRQQAALEPLASTAAEVQRRMQRLEEHARAFAALGREAGEATALLRTNGAEHVPDLESVKARLAKIAEGARALFEAARADDFPDVAREADGLKQRIVAARKRIDEKT